MRACALADGALLSRYVGRGYTDCYFVDVPYAVTHARYVEAFYTTWLFGLERWLLARLVAKPSSDDDVRALAAGRAESFAAWRVEDRAADQLLLSDFRGQTRSWLMTDATPDETGTRLYFGSAVVANVDARTGRTSMGLAYRALLGFHKLYSRALLGAAVARLRRAQGHRG
jgi:hypothetical protein